MKLHVFIFIICALFASNLYGQFGPDNGLKDSDPDYILLQNATLLVKPGQVLKATDILIQKGKIVKVGKQLKQVGAVVLDYTDKVIVPSFVELYSDVGLDPLKYQGNGWRPQLESNKEGAYYWNEAVHPELSAAAAYHYQSAKAEQLLQSGFGFALTHYTDGIVRGSGALVALGSSPIHQQIVKAKAAQYFSFEKGGSQQSYPSSQMGSIALLRQAFYDLNYYKSNAQKLGYSASLDEWSRIELAPAFFKTSDKWDILRAAKIAQEFKTPFVYVGSGNEYAIAQELQKINANLVLPINFPEAFDVKDPYLASQIALSDLKHWELAPANAAILAKTQIQFALTTQGLKNPELFWANLRKAINRGLTADQALASLTTIPAKWLGLDQQIGTLEEGKLASFSVYNGNPFTHEAVLLESWNLGEQKIWKTTNVAQILGTYTIRFENQTYNLQLSGTPERPQGKVWLIQGTDSLHTRAQIIVAQEDISIQFLSLGQPNQQLIQLHGKVLKNGAVLEGEGTNEKGAWMRWSAIQNKKTENQPLTALKPDTLSRNEVWFPNMAFGNIEKIKPQTILFKNATVWTNEKEGILVGADVLVQDGKIVKVSRQSISAPSGARIIDAKGLHLTSGIIDEHSHIAISKGVNEGGQAISAEVSIADVVNPDDIDIYRQLAGGVTAAQLLHGSANPIGGQSALIKLKWGQTAEEMLIDNAPKFIKFALGENVKQANWGDFNTVRFPQTRMGVEQVFYDGFYRAKAYQEEWSAYREGKLKTAPRVDLELEVLSEILRSERFITCHSYIQSEINMLMHVADSMGFRVNTFTHILEGYKVADKMKAHGVAGSTFSDWWAYKFEVNDAIPYNAALMQQQGVLVCLNSDDAEMGRRLNQEAAKAIKYGGMTEEEAWKLVTLNPAKILHLDQRMGSIKVGKDADLVLWTAHPLSIQARAAMTIIEGVVYYEEAIQEQKLLTIQKERNRILALMLAAAELGEPTKTPQKKTKKHFHCDTLGEEAATEENTH
ncbi:MAG: amidohydrolase family protein [Flavobacteriales bacterium]